MENFLNYCNKYLREITCCVLVFCMLGAFCGIIFVKQEKDIYIAGIVAISVLEIMTMAYFRPRYKSKYIRDRYARVWTYIWSLTTVVIIFWKEVLEVGKVLSFTSYAIVLILGAVLLRIALITAKEKRF